MTKENDFLKISRYTQRKEIRSVNGSKVSQIFNAADIYDNLSPKYLLSLR